MLKVFSTTLLIVNRVVGTGIYTTPAQIIKSTNSVGATLLFWVLGGIMTVGECLLTPGVLFWYGFLTSMAAGLFVYLEFGTAIPRSGGEKIYVSFLADESAGTIERTAADLDWLLAGASIQETQVSRDVHLCRYGHTCYQFLRNQVRGRADPS